ncbi:MULTISPECIES: sugar phosphate isomerase/epimerase family protein [unclassified Methanoregula]|uniref:sugar phosphate isomerase/epimerase family protein n=1 Tax=unclassified Methanoregula TaxID=2649730 RepID=UPI0009CB7369|nr:MULTISPECIES: sugar phosphate isomerase/epimerase family protein [unclassified Methanoregula]OPX64398.1 MAG: endonuclease IV [Methanoregula sp. PtaB.Bin085]OPY34932.1 MAG: endonuclease IV [Methanoregula sp. PtaU1.Bin006]
MSRRPLFISTYCCIDQPLDKALGILAGRTTHVEILSDGLHNLLDGSAACDEYPLTYTVHAPTSETNIASVNERMRSASVAVLEDVLVVCNRINATRCVVHPGYSAYEQVKDRSSASLLRSLDDIVRLQDEHGVRVCVENMGAWECCHFRTPAFIPELALRGLGMTLDCGHARLNGNLDAFLAAGGSCHVHLHDNDGCIDDHAACGSGTTDFTAVLPRLPTDASLVVETRGLAAADESICCLSSILNGEKS